MGVALAPAEEIKHEFCFWEQMIPQVEQEVIVGAAQPGNKMDFECMDGVFSGIAVVYVWQDQLKVNVFGSEKLLEGCRGFVVQVLKFQS